jgi:DNA-binding CsgD family transcriptional regulator
MLAAMSPEQKKLLSFVPPPTGITIVNDRVLFRTEGTRRVISVHGVVFAHYDVTDRAAEAYAMITLFESGYADQNDIARCFGYSTRSLRRYQQRLEIDGLGALASPRGRPSFNSSDRTEARQVDRTILHLKAQGFSNRVVAGRIGLDERSIRRHLRRLGWVEPPSHSLLFPPEISDETTVAAADVSIPGAATSLSDDAAPESEEEDSAIEPVPNSFDVDPPHRSMDRLLASMGVLEDAAPLFACVASVARAGVLLAIPALVSSGLLTIARKIYGGLGPAFYGLRTTLVAYVLLALLRIPRPEALKEYAPDGLGHIVGLDRMPEVKTLRRKLGRLAQMKRSHELGQELARRRVRERGRLFGFLYVDGHVRAYHGKHSIPKAFLTRTRLAVPATTDYWVNDKKGDPLFVVTAMANAAMTRMLLSMLEEARKLVGSHRRITIVFDRGGWSPILFQKLLETFDILTYRKGRFRHISEKRFVLRKARLDGRSVEYLLHDQPVRFLKGKLRLRQVTRLTDTGHQTPVLTSRWDLRDIIVAYRMFERWRQENFFKYMRQEFLIDALADYQVEPDDPTRLVPNPARKAVEKELRAARTGFAKLQEEYGSTALDYLEGRTATMREFTSDEKRIHREIKEAANRIAALVSRLKSLPKHIPLAQSKQGQEVVKLSTERKHLTNVLKMVAYQIESDLVERLRPHYARVDDEGRTLIQTVLQNAAALEPAENELRITLAPLSSEHRSKAVAALCQDLNRTNTVFPGTNLRMYFAVAQPSM